MHKTRLLLLLVLFFSVNFLTTTTPTTAQRDLVELAIEPGYGGSFRDNLWMPVRVTVTNNGDPVEGVLTLRPERSDALTNAFVTPVSLPSGARQTFFMYVTLRSFGTNLRVELIDNNGFIVADQEQPVRSIGARDRLYVVLTNAATSAISLDDVHPAEREAIQVNWFVNNIPDRAPALQAIDAMIFSDIDSSTLSPDQRSAINSWVAGGGHLIVTGGAGWQPTAAGLTELLPFVPSGSEASSEIDVLARLAGDYNTSFTEDTILTTGRLQDDATALLVNDDNQVLLARRSYGLGTVDYLTVDPSLQPLRDWDNLSQMWFTMLSSTASRPPWANGFVNLREGTTALEILPGQNAAPEILAMVVFLAAYVLLIGPVNYLILRAINRRELAWITIPITIGVFSVLAWVTGFNLRGNEVTLSRLTVIQSWPDVERAHVDQLIGLLAPRRADYTLTIEDERLIRPIPRTGQSGLFSGSASNVTIEQGATFAARDFPVDASFVAGFITNSTLSKPAVSGRVSLQYRAAEGMPDGYAQSLRGSIRNETDFTITDPVILAQGITLPLNGPLAPGDQYVLDTGLVAAQSIEAPAPSPLEYSLGNAAFGSSFSGFTSRTGRPQNQSVIDILGSAYRGPSFGFPSELSEDQQETVRRQNFLNTFIIDQYLSSARGNRVYLAGWLDTAPLSESLGGSLSSTVDSTLLLVELEVEVNTLPGDGIIPPDRFTWIALNREGSSEAAPFNSTVFNDLPVAFRFTPLPDAQLAEVDELYVIMERSGGTNRALEVRLWDWQAEEWVIYETLENRTRIENPARFIGPLNAVQVQVQRSISTGSLFIERLAVEQRGTF